MEDALFIKMALATAALASDDVVLIHLDSDNVIGCASDGFCSLVGTPKGDLIGKTLASFFPEGTAHHAHGDPIITEDFEGLKSVPFIKGDRSVIYLDLDIQKLIWPNQTRPHYCAFAKRVKRRTKK